MGEVLTILYTSSGQYAIIIIIGYRIKHVERANESNAIDTLMVTDELFR